MNQVINEIRHDLFAHRNGVVADALKAGGDPHEMIMGCPLSDIIAIAARHEPSPDLAEALWADTRHRECRLMATMLYPVAECRPDTALRWSKGVQTTEEADVLCHRLLRHLDCAQSVTHALLAEQDFLPRYVAYRLMLNLTMLQRMTLTDELRRLIMTEAERCSSPALRQVLNALLDD